MVIDDAAATDGSAERWEASDEVTQADGALRELAIKELARRHLIDRSTHHAYRLATAQTAAQQAAPGQQDLDVIGAYRSLNAARERCAEEKRLAALGRSVQAMIERLRAAGVGAEGLDVAIGTALADAADRAEDTTEQPPGEPDSPQHTRPLGAVQDVVHELRTNETLVYLMRGSSTEHPG